MAGTDDTEQIEAIFKNLFVFSVQFHPQMMQVLVQQANHCVWHADLFHWYVQGHLYSFFKHTNIFFPDVLHIGFATILQV